MLDGQKSSKVACREHSVEPDMQERKHVQQIPWLEEPFNFFQFPVPVLLELFISVLLVLKCDYDA